MAAGSLSVKDIPQIASSVYDCVVDASRWTHALGDICRMAGARLATLAVLDTITNKPRFSVTFGDPAVVDPLLGEYANDVPFYSALPMMDVDLPFTVDMIYALQGAGAREAWLSSRIVQEWVIPNRLDDFFWTVLLRQPTRVGNFIVMTDRDRPQITQSERNAMASLAPHVRRALTIGDLFEEERQRTMMFREVIENFAHPVVIVAADMRVLFANRAAETLLEDRTMLMSSHGRISFTYAPAGAAIQQAVSLGERNEFALGPAGISVPLVQVRAPAVAHVLPLARRGIEAGLASASAAAIFIAEAGYGPIAALDAIAALFGLTAAEKRVAANVANGRSRNEIAHVLGVSDGTVKSQLSAIFDKTGAGDQRELQLLMRELSPPVRSDPDG